MQQIKRTFANVATLLRDIQEIKGQLNDDLMARVDKMSEIISATGDHIIDVEILRRGYGRTMPIFEKER